MGRAIYNNSGSYLYYDDYNDTKDDTFLNPGDEDYEKYKFNRQYYDDLVANFQYTEAAKYAKNYHWDDPEKDRVFHQTIRNLENEGRKLEAEFSRIDSEDDKNAVKFYRSFNNNTNFNSSDNSYMQAWNATKENFLGRDAVSLEFVFGKKKRTLLGIDWAYADNNLNFDNFLESSGMSLNDLNSAGIQPITLDDGSVKLRISKTNKLANRILYELGKFTKDYGYNKGVLPLFDGADGIKINGYDVNNKQVTTYTDDLSNNMVSNAYKTVTFNKRPYDSAFDIFYNMVNAAEKVSNRVSAPQNVSQTYSSTVGPTLSDDLDRITKAYNAGYMKPNDYYKAREHVIGKLEGLISRIGVHNYEMYSNMNNDNFTDMTQVPLDNKSKSVWQTLFNAVDPKNISYGTQVVNGTIGLLITIDPISLNEDTKAETKLVKQLGIDTKRTINVWIPEPDFAMTALQNAIGNDTKIRAVKEIGDMNNYNYEYNTVNNCSIKPDMTGEYDYVDKLTKRAEKISHDEAIRRINKDMSIRDAITYLPYHYVDRNNYITDDSQNYGSYDDAVWQWSIKTANELYPKLPFMDDAGNIITDPEKIKEIVNSKGYEGMQFELEKKYVDVGNIYKSIIDNTSYFNRHKKNRK